MQDFDRFQQLVFSDPALLAELRQAPDLPTLMARVLAAGRDRGYAFSEQDLQEVLNTNRRAWLERWL